MPKILTGPQKRRNPLDDFPVIDDDKLRVSLSLQADKWNEFARAMIYQTYNDNELLLLYKAMRDAGQFQTGGKSKVRREVLRFPNGYVYNFCRAVFEPEYGRDWPINPKVWRHELIRPWLLIDLK